MNYPAARRSENARQASSPWRSTPISPREGTPLADIERAYARARQRSQAIREDLRRDIDASVARRLAGRKDTSPKEER